MDASLIIGIIGALAGIYGIRRSIIADRKMDAMAKAQEELNRDFRTYLQLVEKANNIGRKPVTTKEDEEYLKLYLREIGELLNKHTEWAIAESEDVRGVFCQKCGGPIKEVATFPRPNVPKVVTPVKARKCSVCGAVRVTYGWN